MHEIEIPEINKRFFLPASLESFTTKQYMILCELLLMLDIRTINYVQFKYLLTVRLLGLPEEIKNQAAKENIMLISDLFDSLFTINENKILLNGQLDSNPLPFVSTLTKTFYGPYDYFTNITFGEFVQGLNEYYACITALSISNLVRLFKVFYRPRKRKYLFQKLSSIQKKGKDIRSNKKITPRQEKYIHPGALFGFFLFFKSFHESLSDSVMQVEGQDIDFSILFSDNRTNTNKGFKSDLPGLGMKGIAFHIANTGGLGDLQNVNKLPMWEVLLFLYDMKKSELDQEKQAEQQKKNEK